LVLCLAVTTPVLAAEEDPALEEIIVLGRAGATGLALHLLQEYQDSADTARWVAAERERLHILAMRADWERIVARMQVLPEGLSQSFTDWRTERQVEALLHLGRGAEARDALQQLIWSVGAPDPGSLQRWRSLLVRSYLADGDRDSALVALRRYSQDYGNEDASLRAMHGEALILTGRAGEALDALSDGDDEPIRSLRWLARLHADGGSAAAVLEASIRAGSVADAPPLSRKAAWGVAAEAAGMLGNHAARVAALQRHLLLDRGAGLPVLLRAEPGELWTAYVDWGRAIANAAQLIVGLDDDWMQAAVERMAVDPGQARALFAVLAAQSPSAATATEAHSRFARSLASEQGGEALLVVVYLDGDLFPAPADIPAAVRYLLVDEVLRERDIERASGLIADLAEPPEGAEPGEWAMRRARVLVLAGRGDAAFEVLADLLSGETEYDVDRMLQVVFDMQSAGAHEHAVAVLAAVDGRADLAPQQQREIAFWMADSQLGLGAYAEAARLYLRSATRLDPYAMDPWAQTARFQAAEALARAGLRDDAIVVLQSLLNATEDAGRQAMLRQQIDQYRR
jgi:hypothetical protein